MGGKCVVNAQQHKVWVFPWLQAVLSFQMCYGHASYMHASKTSVQAAGHGHAHMHTTTWASLEMGFDSPA